MASTAKAPAPKAEAADKSTTPVTDNRPAVYVTALANQREGKGPTPRKVSDEELGKWIVKVRKDYPTITVRQAQVACRWVEGIDTGDGRNSSGPSTFYRVWANVLAGKPAAEGAPKPREVKPPTTATGAQASVAAMEGAAAKRAKAPKAATATPTMAAPTGPTTDLAKAIEAWEKGGRQGPKPTTAKAAERTAKPVSKASQTGRASRARKAS